MQSFDERLAQCKLDREQMHAYQGKAGDFIKAHPFSALFVDLGLGKTVSTLTALLDLVCDMEVDCILVIAPIRVANETWPTELVTWRHLAPMTAARIRDEDLVDRINTAGQAAAALLKKWGANHPDVQAVLRKYRMMKLRQHAKSKLGFAGPQIVKYAREKIDEAMLKEATPEELKFFREYSRKQEAKAAVRDHKRLNPATIYVINREQVEFLVDAWGVDWPYDCVVIDESSSLKDHSTNRWKALRKVRPFMRRMHQLTATPAAESYLHLFGQIGLLDMGERLGTTFTEYTSTYFKKNEYNHTYKMLPGAEEKIAEKISDICLTMKAEDYLPLEKPVVKLHRIQLNPKAQAIYDEMEQTSIVQLGDRLIEAETAAALSSKLLQLCSGVLYETYLEEDFDTEEMVKVKAVHKVHDQKIETLKEILAEHEGENFLVVYHFKSSLDRLQKAFPKAKVMDAQGTMVKTWNSGKLPMLLVHPQSAGHGLNLQHGGRHVLFFDLPWSLELYLQTIGRLARQGQKLVVYVHHLLAKGCLDEQVYRALSEKRDVQEELFKILKRLRNRLTRG